MPTIWITGASSGIGEALAYTYAKAGYRLILSARNETRLKEVASQCQEAESVDVVPLDVSDLEAVSRTCTKVEANTGGVDILVNNAGISQRSNVVDTLLEVDQKVFQVNFFGAIAMTKALLPGMLARGSGKVVVVSSLVGKFGTPMRSAYAASKHALHGFYDALRAETHQQGLQVTLICPGYVRTQVSVNAVTGSGGKHGQMDENQERGMDAMVCARKIKRAVDVEKREVYIGGKEVMAVYLKRFFPALFARLARNLRPIKPAAR